MTDRTLHPMRGILLLALANVVGFLAISWITANFYSTYLALPWALVAMKNAVVQSQRASYGIAAALLPQRRFVGLAWATGLGLICGLVQADILTMISISRAHFALRFDEMLWHIAGFADQTMAMFVLTQATRFLCGWRLIPKDQPFRGQRGQFRVGDLLEWTASVAAWLGIHRLAFFESYDYWTTTIGAAVIVLPIALAAASNRGLRLPALLGLLTWIAAAELFLNVLGYFCNPSAFAGPWWLFLTMSVAWVAGCLLCTGINFAIIRRLGFQWVIAQPRSESRAAGDE